MSQGSGWSVVPTDSGLNRISQEYSFEDVATATGNFSPASRLGVGSYGTVYRGVLRDGTEVAIKELLQPNEAGFKEEVEVLSRFRHPNLVILLGFARNASKRYLLYELLSAGDLCARLQEDPCFDWRMRVSVLLDAALGLSHLHGCRPQVFHRDIKSQNILMDRNGTGKMADFGLALLANKGCESMTVQNASGTLGYADPSYISSGTVTEQTEVYSYGAVLLEVLTGRPPALQDSSGHIEYQFMHLHGQLSNLIPMLDARAKWPQNLADQLGRLAFLCMSPVEKERPRFAQIVSELRHLLREFERPRRPPDASLNYLSTGGTGGTGSPTWLPPYSAASPAFASRAGQSAGYAPSSSRQGHVVQRVAKAAEASMYALPASRVQLDMPPQSATGGSRSAVNSSTQGIRPNGSAVIVQREDSSLIDDSPVASVDCSGGDPIPSRSDQFELAPPTTAEVVDPARAEEAHRLQVELGFSAYQVAEAFRRCSTSEGAVDWILSPEREWNCSLDD